MTTTFALTSALRLARATIAELSPDDAVLAQIDRALLSPPAFTIGLSPRAGRDLQVELPSGTIVDIPASPEAIRELCSWLRQHDADARRGRAEPDLGKAQAQFFARTSVGTRAAPVQWDIDRALLRKFDSRGNEILPQATEADFAADDEDEILRAAGLL